MNRNNPHTVLYRWMTFLRILLGLVFIFSSVAKGIDPVGTSYRVEDYLLVYRWMPLVPYAMEIAFLIIFSEFLIGIAFLFNTFIRTAAVAMLAILVFFLVVTFFDALYNMVPDCGCFGDALKLTNWQTFYKNIVLIVLNLLFMWKSWRWMNNRTKPVFQIGLLTLFGGLFLGFMFYNLDHLPVIDFRNWKVGRNMCVDTMQKARTYVTFENIKTGEKKEFLFPDYPWKDSLWRANWKFISKRTIAPSVVKKYNLVIEDSLGNDRTRAIIEYPGFQFLLISFNLHQANASGLKKAAVLWKFLKKRGISMVMLTATDEKTTRRIENIYGMPVPAYLADETDLKSVIRSNPGLLLLDHGIILQKWHYHDFPDTLQVKKYLISPTY